MARMALWRFAIVGLLAAFSFGCGGPNQYVIQGGQIASGADGNITVGSFDDGNSSVEIEVSHLAPAARVKEGTTIFVVWFKPEDGQPAKAGNLAYDDDERTGTLHATSANRSFEVIITAERDESASSPSDAVVFRQAVEVP